ncbi:MAG TPA: hypothetical protein VMV42_01405 [archaeon]|nr:hypothetical protein [archaeon]
MPTIHTEGDRARLVLEWLSWADNDYIAARLLLRRRLLSQGAALANTALEKYFKALVFPKRAGKTSARKQAVAHG